jgi:glutathione synthase/RimK-type ligase-like ATP-grasp enzyme
LRILDLSIVQSGLFHAGLWRNLVNGLNSWLEHIPGIVINRPGGDAHNFSKPLHEAFLLKSGLDLPNSLTSSDGQLLFEFANKGQTVVKPLSAIRATSRLVSPKEFLQFDPSLGPVHLQRYVSGMDVRVHVVDNTVHAELIKSNSVDYRRAEGVLEFSPHQLPDSLIEKIVRATRKMRLLFAGWDFKLSEEKYWCLEANPMPGYDGYDRRLKGKITESLLKLLLLSS